MRLRLFGAAVLIMGGSAILATTVTAEKNTPAFWQFDDGTIVANGQMFANWEEYAASELFLDRKCASPALADIDVDGGIAGGNGNDCSMSSTDADSNLYDPGIVKYSIPVVFHVIRNSSGTLGNVSMTQIENQIDVLNEDFLAIPGSNGALGADVQIEFHLATTDPNGQPTTGVTYSNNTTWYNDGGNYWNTLAWDPDNYLNIYTNSAGGALGYVPGFPAQGIAGQIWDRVVVYWASVGKASPNPPYNWGRTATHEVGHYLGLFHTFEGGCGTTQCYITGDLICDTERESQPHFGCQSFQTCGDPDPYRNYMDYTDDLCMTNFTYEQGLRMRCTLEHWRSSLYDIIIPGPGNNDCVNAPLVFTGTYAFTTVEATTDGFSEAACAGFEDDVWYRLGVFDAGTMTVSICDADYDSMLAIYSGGCPDGRDQALACNDDFCGTGSEITMSVEPGLYYARVGGKNGSQGSGNLVFDVVPGVPCDADIAGDDGVVDTQDLLALLAAWGTNGAGADLAEPTDIVDTSDLLALLAAWGDC